MGSPHVNNYPATHLRNRPLGKGSSAVPTTLSRFTFRPFRDRRSACRSAEDYEPLWAKIAGTWKAAPILAGFDQPGDRVTRVEANPNGAVIPFLGQTCH